MISGPFPGVHSFFCCCCCVMNKTTSHPSSSPPRTGGSESASLPLNATDFGIKGGEGKSFLVASGKGDKVLCNLSNDGFASGLQGRVSDEARGSPSAEIGNNKILGELLLVSSQAVVKQAQLVSGLVEKVVSVCELISLSTGDVEQESKKMKKEVKQEQGSDELKGEKIGDVNSGETNVVAQVKNELEHDGEMVELIKLSVNWRNW